MLTLYHIKRAIGTILKFRSHTAFSLIGLVIGLACVFIISAWVVEELRFDRFHQEPDRIYMVLTDIKDNTGLVKSYPETPPPLAEALETEIPEIERGFHFLYLYGGRSLEREDLAFTEAGIAATPAFLEVFNFPMVSGDPADLDEPGTIFLSRSLADKLFPDGQSLGKELLYKEDQLLVVRGVFRDVPRNSSLQFDFLIPYEMEYGISEEWWQLSDATFIRTSPAADMEKVHALMIGLWRERINDEQFDIGMIPVTDLRYGADFEFFNAEHGHGRRNRLFMFLGVAVMILVLACLNYMNLVSAYAIKREFEVGMRKIHGASSGNMANYFLVESVILSVLAWLLAALLALLGLRIFEHLMGIVISSSYFFACIGAGLLVSMCIVGLASGIYPALRAAGSMMVHTQEANRPGSRGRSGLRSVLVISQFVLSIALSVSSLVILRQTSFMRYFDTGYTSEGIVEFDMPDQELCSEVKNWLHSQPAVEHSSYAGSSPVSLTVLNTTEKWTWEGLPQGEYTSFFKLDVDEEYLDVFEIPLVRGRFFSSSGEDPDQVVVNEKLAAVLGFENPVGQILRQGDRAYTIVGVVRDFNFQHLKTEIRPLVMMYRETGRHLFVKLNPGAVGTVGDIREKISELSGQSAGFRFIIEEHDALYEGEQQMLSAVLIFTLLCILLSSLGLIGLVTYETEARTREIAIRKVLGADTGQAMITLNLTLLRNFLPGVLVGCLLAWLVMRKWLQDFVYRRDLEAWVFIAGALIIFLLALVSVSFQTWKAARRSPASALKVQ